MVTWNCGDVDANVAAGSDDAMVRTEAQQLAATDVPVLLRWFPDPNQTGSPGVESCLGSAGAGGYVAAYQHIRGLFAAAGARNGAFVWSVDTSAAADPNLSSYYPGGVAVDWIAADGGATAGDESQVAAFTSEFGSWYASFSTAGKPMMVSSIGVPAGSQPTYLAQIASAVPSVYPQIRSVIYFDAPDPSTGAQDQLGPTGAASFQQLAASPAFTPPRSPSTTTISVSQSSIAVGAVLTLRAAVDASDNGGSVSFVDNGTPIRGCAFVAIRAATMCRTAKLAAGPQKIVAMYGGDATFAPSTSKPLSITVNEVSAPVGAPGVGNSPNPSTGIPSGSRPTSPPDVPVGTTDPAPAAAKVVVPTAGSAYLGSFVDPSGGGFRAGNPTGGIASLSSELTALPSVARTLARPLSIVPLFLTGTIRSR